MPMTMSPVQEVSLSAQFQALPVNLMDIADLVGRFAQEFPIFQQAPPTPPFVVSPVPVEITFNIPPDQVLPRAWLVSEDGHLLLQIQPYRIGINWRRLAPSTVETDYPGYEALLDRFLGLLEVVKQWAADRVQAALVFDAAELMYTNLIPMEIEGSTRRISEVLSFYTPQTRTPVVNFQVHWSESLTEEYPGWLNCIFAPGAMTIEGGSGMMATFIGRWGLGDVNPSELVRRFNVAHDKVHDLLPYLFRSSVLETMK